MSSTTQVNINMWFLKKKQILGKETNHISKSLYYSERTVCNLTFWHKIIFFFFYFLFFDKWHNIIFQTLTFPAKEKQLKKKIYFIFFHLMLTREPFFRSFLKNLSTNSKSSETFMYIVESNLSSVRRKLASHFPVKKLP